jgi:hypothetical protein
VHCQNNSFSPRVVGDQTEMISQTFRFDLIECTADASDRLRLNAAMALSAVREVMKQLLDNSTMRVRLLAASALAIENPEDAKVAAILVEASGDPTMQPHHRLRDVLAVMQALPAAQRNQLASSCAD